MGRARRVVPPRRGGARGLRQAAAGQPEHGRDPQRLSVSLATSRLCKNMVREIRRAPTQFTRLNLVGP